MTGHNGVFDIALDGHLIYSKAKTGRHARDGEVLALFTGIVGPNVCRCAKVWAPPSDRSAHLPGKCLIYQVSV